MSMNNLNFYKTPGVYIKYVNIIYFSINNKLVTFGSILRSGLSVPYCSIASLYDNLWNGMVIGDILSGHERFKSFSIKFRIPSTVIDIFK